MTTREVSNEKGITETSRENGLTITKQGFHTARFSANISAEHGKLFAPTIVGNTLILTQGNLLLTARLIRADPSNLNPELQKLVDAGHIPTHRLHGDVGVLMLDCYHLGSGNEGAMPHYQLKPVLFKWQEHLDPTEQVLHPLTRWHQTTQQKYKNWLRSKS